MSDAVKRTRSQTSEWRKSLRPEEKLAGCKACRDGTELPFSFTMAFQPIVDLAAERVWGYEALVRGLKGEGAGSVLTQVTEDLLYRFDQACRVRAIELAGKLFPRDDATRLSINFMPNAVYEPSACIRASLLAAARAGFARERLMFEFTENERMVDTDHVSRIVTEYRRQGFWTALDDFGAGYAGLGLLTKLTPDLIKLDMDLIRGINTDLKKQAIIAGLMQISRTIGIEIIAEGIETVSEVAVLRAAGIKLFQGYYFAKPAVETLPQIASEAMAA